MSQAAFRWSIPERFNIGADVVDRHAAAGISPALIEIDASGRVSELSFRAIVDLTNRLANVLVAHGLSRGDRVAILLPQRRETAVAHVAVYKAGLVAVPLFKLFGEEALEFRLQNSGARAIVTDRDELPKIERLRQRLPDLHLVLCVEGPGEGAVDLQDALARASDRFATVATAAEDHLGVQRVTMLGHSTGGMLAVRYALLHPQQVEQLVLVNPIGLEDWKALGVPWRSIDDWYARELKTTAASIRQYEQATYYAGQWQPEYERWVQMLAGMYRGRGKDIVAWSSALLYDMIFAQPVLYEFDRIQAPTLLMIGQKDNTAIGKDAAPSELRKKLGDYPRLGKEAARRFPHATLVEFPELGHAPQIQDPVQFHEALLKGLLR